MEGCLYGLPITVSQMPNEKHGYNVEQALGMLFWHKHNIEKSLADLPNFTPFPDEWTVEDKVLFEQAFSFHGKSFHRIQQMLPDKTIASLVKYYYSWKKTRSRTSLMDRQARKLANRHNQGDSDDDVEEPHPMDGNDIFLRFNSDFHIMFHILDLPFCICNNQIILFGLIGTSFPHKVETIYLYLSYYSYCFGEEGNLKRCVSVNSYSTELDESGNPSPYLYVKPY
ncbi:hypothetical protein P7K49_035915 [Saguinus oedipus]|uniref:REST corepressor 3 n=1 Tax=Saguinus oedipus TaxID=9490 RepID=A0ABQ9TPP3_SAGOE|nr:hypothetical protein P7K49_035915 [Saguinus oedipus]